jgi:hypothetical protein
MVPNGALLLHVLVYFWIALDREFEVELEHQQKNNISNTLIFEKPKKPFIISYEPNCYENGYLILKFQDGTQEEVKFFEKRDNKGFLNKIIKNLKEINNPLEEEILKMIEELKTH